MNGIFRRLCGVLGAGVLVVSFPLAIGVGFRLHNAREERALNELRIDAFEIKGATLDDALWEITRKVHALGHPEVEFIVYREGDRIPGFHRRLAGESDFKPDQKLDLTMTPDPLDPRRATVVVPRFSSGGMPSTLGRLLSEVELYFDRPCLVRGHRLVAAHAAGSLQPFYRVTIEFMPEMAWRYYSADGIKAVLNENGLRYCEGMSVTYVWGTRGLDKFDVYAPPATIEYIQSIVGANQGMPWELWKQRMIWRYEEFRAKFL